MKNTILFNELKGLYEKNITSFHVPGHKNGKIYKKYHADFVKYILNIDTTEIPGTDNLHSPEGIIKRAQERASKIYGTRESFFLVNGTTCGIYSMILAITNPKDKIIIPRDCHKSVFNALILGDLIPVYIKPEVDSKGLAMGISPRAVEEAIKENPDVKGVLITYPNYYGICSPLEEIAEVVHRHGKILLVDEAHGAHLDLSDELPVSALKAGADIVAQSTHKTLPALTQSSLLHVNSEKIDIDRLKFMLSLTQSSSPSYILMASLDMAMAIYEKEGKALMEGLLKNLNSLRERLSKFNGVEVLSKDIIGSFSVRDLDITKVTISMANRGIGGVKFGEILRDKYGIQVELTDIYNILLVTTIGNEEEDFERLYNAIKEIYEGTQVKEGIIKNIPKFDIPLPKIEIPPRDALYREKRQVDLRDSKGKVSGEYIIPYPPGIPLICPGEVISGEIIEYIEISKTMGINIIGPRDTTLEKIEIIK